MKWLLTIALLFFHTQNHFRPKNLYRDIPFGSEPTSQITSLLAQKFTYLGEGSQMYAFISEDEQTVLKLFKARHQKHFKVSRFLSHLTRSQEDWTRSRQRWQQKFHDTCRRYKWAHLDLREETGLLFIHFEKTPLPLPVVLLDKYTYEIDLAKHPFILQKKAVLTPDYFRKNPQKKEAATLALKEFFISRLEKGFNDPRQSLSINFGFIDDKPVQIDVGKIEPFTGDPSAELEKIHAHIDAWVSAF